MANKTFPRWLKWTLLGIVAYVMLYNHFRDVRPSEEAPGVDKPAVAAPKPAGEGVTETISTYSKAFRNARKLSVEVVKDGAGTPAQCGQGVLAHYKVVHSSGKELFTTHGGEPARFRLGRKEVISALEMGVLGMKPEGLRRIEAPAFQAYDAPAFARADIPKGTPVTLEVAVQALIPPLPHTRQPVRQFDEVLGAGRLANCGGEVTVSLAITRADGEAIYPAEGEKSITFTVGAGTQPAWLEQGVIGMVTGGKRVLLVPPALATFTFDAPDAWLKEIKTANQALIVDLHLRQVLKD